jgi:hypothetical protein
MSLYQHLPDRLLDKGLTHEIGRKVRVMRQWVQLQEWAARVSGLPGQIRRSVIIWYCSYDDLLYFRFRPIYVIRQMLVNGRLMPILLKNSVAIRSLSVLFSRDDLSWSGNYRIFRCHRLLL